MPQPQTPLVFRLLINAGLFTLFSSLGLNAAVYYVDCKTGVNDANAGSISRPYATIQAAVTRAAANDTVLIRGGVYAEEITIQNKSGLTLSAYQASPDDAPEEVVVTGTDVIEGWEQVTVGADAAEVAVLTRVQAAGKVLYRSNGMTWSLNPVANGVNPAGLPDLPGRDQLFFDGVMITLARHPNNFSHELLSFPRLALTGSSYTNPVDKFTQANVDDPTKIQTLGVDFSLPWATGENELTGAWMHQLGTARVTVTLVDGSQDLGVWQYGMGQSSRVESSSAAAAAGTVSARVRLFNKYATTSDQNRRFYLPIAGTSVFFDGLFSFLDNDWEWFRRSDNDTLYICARSTGFSPNNRRIEAKKRLYGLRLINATNTTVRHLRLFACTAWVDTNSTGNVLENLDLRYPSYFAGVMDDPYRVGVEAFSGSGNEFDYWRAALGVYLDGKNNTFRNSTVGFTAGSAVSVVGENNRVINNLLHNVNYRGSDGAGVAAGGRGYTHLWHSSLANQTLYPGTKGLPTDHTARIAFGAEIAHNTVYNTSRAALLARGLYAGSLHHNLLFQTNHNTSDYGTIYALRNIDQISWRDANNVTQRRTVDGGGGMTRISRNYLHTTSPREGADVNALYIDNNSFDYIVDHNVHYEPRPNGPTSSSLVTAISGDNWSGIHLINNTLLRMREGDRKGDGLASAMTTAGVRSPVFDANGTWLYTAPTTKRSGAVGMSSRFLNNLTLNESSFIWASTLVTTAPPSTALTAGWINSTDETDPNGRTAVMRNFRTIPGLINDANRTGYRSFSSRGGLVVDPAELPNYNITSSHYKYIPLRDLAGGDFRLPAVSFATRQKGLPVTLAVPDTTQPRNSDGRYPPKLLAITRDTTPDIGAYGSGDWEAGAGVSAPGVGSSTFSDPTFTFTRSGKITRDWNFEDIGADAINRPAGYTSLQRGNFTMTGGGAGWDGPADSFHFVRRVIDGLGTLQTAIHYLESEPTLVNNVDQFAFKNGLETGLMIRADTQAGAPFVAVTLNPKSRILRLLSRTTANASPTVVASTTLSLVRLPLSLRLQRSNTGFTASYSTDGITTFKALGSATVNAAIPTVAFGGAVVTTASTITPPEVISVASPNTAHLKISLSTVSLGQLSWDDTFATWNTRRTAAGFPATESRDQRLLGYAFGADATQVINEAQCLPRVGRDAATQRLTLAFTGRKTGVTYVVEESTDLVTWSALGATHLMSRRNRDDGLEDLTYRASATGPRVFLRVKVDAF